MFLLYMIYKYDMNTDMFHRVADYCHHMLATFVIKEVNI